MTALRQLPTGRTRRGVTLLEMLLVLVLLVAMAALVWPAMERPFASWRLRRAADRVRAAWNQARVRAMTTGNAQEFRYVMGGNEFRTGGRDMYGTPFSIGDAPAGEPSTGSGSSAERMLPKLVTFEASETRWDSRSEELFDQSEESRQQQQGWSEPILFYPDGTSATTRLLLRNEYGHTIEVSLRGLTAVVTVGKVQSEDLR